MTGICGLGGITADLDVIVIEFRHYSSVVSMIKLSNGVI